VLEVDTTIVLCAGQNFRYRPARAVKAAGINTHLIGGAPDQ
jgi:hypothetical protein